MLGVPVPESATVVEPGARMSEPAMAPESNGGPAGAWRRLLYEALWRCSNAFERAANVCVYLAGGLLRRAELRGASEAVWGEFNRSDDAIDLGLEPWERRFFGDHLRAGDRVLLVGCGTGRDLIALCREGYAVTGLDQNASIVGLARAHLVRRNLEAELIASPIELAELDRNYDAVILSNLCYSCILETGTRITMLSRIREHLAPGGRILLSYLSSSGPAGAAWRLANASARLSHSDWRPEPGDVFVRHDRSRRLLWIPHAFRTEDVRRECAAAGLRMTTPLVGGATHCAIAIPAE